MEEKRMIQNIIFDMGGVLIQFPGDAVSRLKLNHEDEEVIRLEVLKEEEWLCLDEGTMSETEAYERICRRVSPRLHSAVKEFLFNWWKGPLCPISGMEELIRELKEQGYSIYLLSNAGIHQKEYFDRLPGSSYFDGRLTSSEYKMLKPFAPIYQKLLELYDLSAETCFFIDDSGNNILSAHRLGMHGVIFHGDILRLRRQMAEAGIRVKR